MAINLWSFSTRFAIEYEFIDWLIEIERILVDFEYIYKELDVKIIDRGESFYQSRMIEVVKELESKSIVHRSFSLDFLWMIFIDFK